MNYILKKLLKLNLAPTKTMRQKHFPSAFTLIELLVVIGIIAILMTILLPTLRKARDTTKTIHCASNLKQLAQCTFSYVDDNNGWIMNLGGSNSWAWQLIPYFSPHSYPKSGCTTYISEGPLTLVRCPKDPHPAWYNFPVSYGQNLWMDNFSFRDQRWVKRTTSVILQIDCDEYKDAYWNIPNTISAHRHNGKWNSSFLDGHVKLCGSDVILDVDSYY